MSERSYTGLEGLSDKQRDELLDRVVLSVTLVAADVTGHQPREMKREWTWREIAQAGPPDLKAPDELEFLRELRRCWPRPQGPVMLSALVVPGHEYDAQEWLDLL